MRVAITGASGYVGRALAEAFTGRGHLVLHWCRREFGSNWHTYQLGDDPDQLPWDQVDTLIHAAYDFEAVSFLDNVERNVLPSIRLLDTAAKNKIKRLILISSLSSFSGTTSSYGKCKLMIESHISKLGGKIVRPGLVWCDQPNNIIGSLLLLMRSSPFIPYPSGGPDSVQFLIHRADLAQIIVNLVESPGNSTSLISVAHPKAWKIREILDTLASRNRIQCKPVPIPWRLLHTSLKIIEVCGLRLRLRSDSLVGLIHGNSEPDLDVASYGIQPRPFSIG